MLVRIEISRFKCIDYIDYHFERNAPFVLFTGFNGVGKSCILEAMAFGLGIELDELRVKDINGFVPQGFTATKNRTFCNLTFTDVKPESSEVVIGSYIDDKTRCYSLNHKKISKNEFDNYLKSLNIYRSSGYYISQNQIHSIMAASAKELYKSIYFVSNVGTIQDEQRKIEKEIVAYNDSNNLILIALNKINDKIEKDQKKIISIERNERISIEIENTELEIKELDSLYYYYSSYNLLYELRKLMSHITSCNDDLLKLSKSIDCENNNHNIKNITVDAVSEFDIVSQELQDIAASLSFVSSCISNNIVELSSEVSLIDSTLANTNNLRIEYCKLEKQSNMLQESLENLVDDINCGINNHNSIVDIIADRKKEIQSMFSTKCSVENLVMSLTDVAMSTLANEHETLSEYHQLLHLMATLKQQEHELLLLTSAKCGMDSKTVVENHIDYHLTQMSQLLQQKETQNESLQITLRDEIRSLQAIQSRLKLPKSSCSINNSNDGDYGSLADIICLFSSDSSTMKYDFALNVILEPLLSIRIVSDSLAAAETIQKMHDARTLRIWPLNKLNDVPKLSELKRPKYYKELLREESFVDPTTLVGINENCLINCNNDVSKVITKALGSYILCDNEKDAISAIHKYQHTEKALCIVTIDGVVHRPGSLHLCETEQTTCNIRLLEEYHKAIFSVRKAQILSISVKKQVESARTGVSDLVRLKHVISEIKVLSEEIIAKNEFVEKITAQRVHDNLQRNTMIEKLESVSSNIDRLQRELEHLNKCSHEGVLEHEIVKLHVEYQMILLNSNNSRKQDLEQQLLILELNRLEMSNSLESLVNQLEVSREKENVLRKIDMELTERKSTLLLQEQSLQQKLASMTKQPLNVNVISDDNALDKLQKQYSYDEHRREQLYADYSNLIQRYQKFIDNTAAKHSSDNEEIHLSHLELYDLLLHLKKKFVTDLDISQLLYEHLELVRVTATTILASLPIQVDCTIESNHDEIFSIGEVCFTNLAIKREFRKLLNDEYNNRGNNKVKKTTSKRKRNPKYSGYESDDIIENNDKKCTVAFLKSSISRERKEYLDLRLKFENVTSAIKQLSNGIISISSVIRLRLSNTFQNVRTRVRTYFNDLVPNKQCDLIQIDSNDLSLGVKFVLVETNASVSNSSISELSGGQKGLLSLSFVFSLCSLKPSPLYLLDEVDAALDEGNQEMVAKVIAKFFQHSQVFCVSHHTAMQLHSDLLINVQIKNGKTVI